MTATITVAISYTTPGGTTTVNAYPVETRFAVVWVRHRSSLPSALRSRLRCTRLERNPNA